MNIQNETNLTEASQSYSHPTFIEYGGNRSQSKEDRAEYCINNTRSDLSNDKQDVQRHSRFENDPKSGLENTYNSKSRELSQNGTTSQTIEQHNQIGNQIKYQKQNRNDSSIDAPLQRTR